jgi:hypothetical protein
MNKLKIQMGNYQHFRFDKIKKINTISCSQNKRMNLNVNIILNKIDQKVYNVDDYYNNQ